MTRPARFMLSALLFCSLSACKVSDDAVAASQQMTSTAATLSHFYSTLEDSVTDTISLYELDAALSGIPYSDADRKQQETTRHELENRKQMADSLAKLAASFAQLTKSSSATDVDTSATALGNELITINALSSTSSVPADLGQAGKSLMQLVQQHEEKKAAQTIDQTLKAIGDLFEKEKPAYDSLSSSHIREASSLATNLVNANEVNYSAMLSPALKPFSLAALGSDPKLPQSLKPLALSRIDATTTDTTQKAEKASAAMLDALREMSSRVHLVATDKPLAVRSEPFSLKLVEEWIESIAPATTPAT